MKREKILAGRIVNAHSIRGEVRVLLPNGDDAVRGALLGGIPVLLDGVFLKPSAVREHKGALLIKLPGVENRDAALSLKGRELYLDRKDVPEGVVFDEELLGMEVRDANGGTLLGRITAVEPYPAHKVYTVKGARTYRIPAVQGAFVQSVDVEGNRMEVRVWEGMADDEF